MNLLLDTSILIEIERRNNSVIKKIEDLTKIHFQPPSISFMNYFEFYFGLYDKNIKNRQAMIEFINKFNCLEASRITAQILGDLKNKYDKKGVVIGIADLIVASQAKENNMILVTKDKTFEKIEEIDKIII